MHITKFCYKPGIVFNASFNANEFVRTRKRYKDCLCVPRSFCLCNGLRKDEFGGWQSSCDPILYHLHTRKYTHLSCAVNTHESKFKVTLEYAPMK